MSDDNNSSRNLIRDAKRIVIKVGTSTITYENGRMNLRNMDVVSAQWNGNVS